MNTPLWLRKWRVVITDINDENAVDVSDLRVTFDIRYRREDSNWGTVSIYNLTQEAEEKIIFYGNRIIIEGGYRGQSSETWAISENGEENVNEEQPQQYGVIFDGQIVFPSRYKESATDHVLTLVVVDGKSALDKNHVAFTLSRGATQKRIAEAIPKNAMFERIKASECTTSMEDVRLPRGKVFFGSPLKYYADICRGNAGTFWVQNGVVHIAKWVDESPDEARVITPQTGLIGMPQQTQYGVSWTMLLDPGVKVGSKFQLKNVFINEIAQRPNQMAVPLDEEWIYQVTELAHKGDTRGNDWYTECSGVSRSGKSPLLAVMNNRGSNPNGH